MPLSAKRAGNNCLARARGLLKASKLAEVSPETRADLRRLAIVMGVVAVDAYPHCAVLKELSEVRRRGELPTRLRNLDLPLSDFAALAESTVEARQQRVHSRPWVQIKNAAQNRLRKMTFQSRNEVAGAMAMIGRSKVGKGVGEILGKSPEDVKGSLNRIVFRRNQIVHEGDIARKARPRGLQLNKLTRTEVEGDLAFLEELVDALHSFIAAG
jgi:hypothetical protein